MAKFKTGDKVEIVIGNPMWINVQSFNITGDLKWGRKWKIPERIESITRKRGSSNTLIISFVGGWQLSFRIHNASKRIEPSFKFDINFLGLPPSVARHVIDYVV